MNDDELNISIRKFLKMVGVSSQREIEQAVARAMQEGAIAGTETFPARMTLEIAGLRLQARFDGAIGMDRLRVLHLNDSKAPFASKKDRHELIGEGSLGEAPFRRMAALGMGVNLFANHHFYWGDEHRAPWAEKGRIPGHELVGEVVEKRTIRVVP